MNGQRWGKKDYKFDPTEWRYDDSVPLLVVSNAAVDTHNTHRLYHATADGARVPDADIHSYEAR